MVNLRKWKNNMKEKKDLAEKYAHKAFLKRNRSNPMSIHDLCFSVTDIKAAFSAGRESVVESLPELKWGQVHYLGKETLNAYTLGASFKIEFSGMEFKVYCNYHFVTSALSISFAKQAADNHYRRMVKQALGL